MLAHWAQFTAHNSVNLKLSLDIKAAITKYCFYLSPSKMLPCTSVTISTLSIDLMSENVNYILAVSHLRLLILFLFKHSSVPSLLNFSVTCSGHIFGHICILQYGRWPTCEVCGVWDDGLTDTERKTEQGVVGWHQRMVSDGHLQSQQDGTGQETLKRDCKASIGHQWEPMEWWLDGWLWP